jgi:hypothetical protein
MDIYQLEVVWNQMLKCEFCVAEDTVLPVFNFVILFWAIS